MKFFGSMLFMAAAFSLSAAEIDVNGDFSKLAEGTPKPARWLIQGKDAAGNASAKKTAEGTVFSAKTGNDKIALIAKTKIPVKQGASLKITVTASGSGWLQGGCHFYKNDNSYTGTIHAPRIKAKPRMEACTAVIDLNDAKAASADFLRTTVTVLPDSEISIQSVKVEITEP